MFEIGKNSTQFGGFLILMVGGRLWGCEHTCKDQLLSRLFAVPPLRFGAAAIRQPVGLGFFNVADWFRRPGSGDSRTWGLKPMKLHI